MHMVDAAVEIELAAQRAIELPRRFLLPPVLGFDRLFER